MHDGLTFCDEALILMLMLVLLVALVVLAVVESPVKTRDSPAAALSKGRPGPSVRSSCFFGFFFGLVLLDTPVDL